MQDAEELAELGLSGKKSTLITLEQTIAVLVVMLMMMMMLVVQVVLVLVMMVVLIYVDVYQEELKK